MEIVNLHDLALQRGLLRMQRALDGLLSTRAVTMPKPSKMPLAVEMSDKLVPVMEDVYWSPIRNGLSEAPEDEDKLRSWLQRQLDNPAVWAALLVLLLRYHKRAVHYGGEIALEILGLSGQFNLTSSEYLALLEARATMLTSADGEMNLIDETVNNLSIAIPMARNATGDTLALLGAYIAGRAISRSAGIGAYEVPWAFNQGLGMTYKENKVKRLMYDVNGEGCPQICAPLHGRTFPIDDIPGDLTVPRHQSCDCVHSPALDDWTKPDDTWTGE